VTLAQLVVDVRRRAALHHDDIHPSSVSNALAILTALGAMTTPEGQTLRLIFAGLALSRTDPAFSHVEIEALTPLALVCLDRLLEAVLDGGMSERELRDALRPSLVRAL
jgi:hypothetical protein